MTGLELKTFLDRRLALEGVSDEQLDSTELYGHLTTARNRIRRRLAIAAPRSVMEAVELEQDATTSTLWAFPAATADPLRVYSVRDLTTGLPLSPALNVKQAGGYEWRSLRQLRTQTGVTYVDGLEVQTALQKTTAIASDTAETAVGLPVPCHEAIGYLAAILALTADEESDARNARDLFDQEMAELETMYAEHDINDGAAVREVFGAAIDDWNNG